MNKVTPEDRKRFEQLDYYIGIGWGHVASVDIERWEKRNKRKAVKGDRAPYGQDNSVVGMITLCGRTQSFTAWANELHCGPNTLRKRIDSGMSEEEIVNYRSTWGRKARG